MAVVNPQQGRARIESWADSLIFTIPTRKRILILGFFGIWLTGWAAGLVAVLSTFLSEGLDMFLLIWLAGWSAGGSLALLIFFWNLAGKEVITVSQRTLKIEKVLFGFRRGKEYLVDEIKNIRLEPTTASIFDRNRSLEMWGLTGGLLKFDYGMKTIKFVSGVDEAEAIYLCERIQEKIGRTKETGAI